MLDFDFEQLIGGARRLNARPRVVRCASGARRVFLRAWEAHITNVLGPVHPCDMDRVGGLGTRFFA